MKWVQNMKAQIQESSNSCGFSEPKLPVYISRNSQSPCRARFLLLCFIMESSLVPEAVVSFQVQHWWLLVLSWLVMSHISLGLLGCLVTYPRFKDLQKWQNISRHLHSSTHRTWLAFSWLLLLKYAVNKCVNNSMNTGSLLEWLCGGEKSYVISSLELIVMTWSKYADTTKKEENF